MAKNASVTTFTAPSVSCWVPIDGFVGADVTAAGAWEGAVAGPVQAVRAMTATIVQSNRIITPLTSLAVSACCHFDLDTYPRVGQSGGDHRSGGADVAEVFPEHGPADGEVAGFGKHVGDSDDVRKTCAGLLEGRRDIPQTLLGLLEQAVRNRHRLIIKTGRARDEDPLPIDDRPRIADLSFERRAGADEPTIHLCLLSIPGRRRTGGPGPGRPAPRTPRPPPPA